MRIALAQINCTVGDFSGNFKKIRQCIKKAEQNGVDVVCFPELAMTGYPPEDLLLKSGFIEDNIKKLRTLAASVGNIIVMVGFVDREDRNIYNAAAIIYRGKIRTIYHKAILPNYGVFDEKRYFKPGCEALVVRALTKIFGVTICEDIWFTDGPGRAEAAKGAKIIFVLNASPYHFGKWRDRETIVKNQARAYGAYIVYVNLVGGQDELVFDGQSMIVAPDGSIIGRAKAFKEDLLLADLEIAGGGAQIKSKDSAKMISILNIKEHKNKTKIIPKEVQPLPVVEEVYKALLLGLKDYISKNGFKKVVIGFSGGIDSSLVAALAVDALGSCNVIGVSMPSPFTSKISKDDAKSLANGMSIKFLTVPIGQIFKTYLRILHSEFKGCKSDVTEENLQARIRGNILMALANKFGWLVLTTGNKSETSVGYATLYGDTAGGFAVIKDVPKVLVYQLAQYRNSLGQVIPQRVLEKAPSAELRPGQKDTDSLPPYDILDPILKAYVEEDKSIKEIIDMGFSGAVARKVAAMVDKNEYKRRQAPPGIKITPKAFGKDRRMPITNRYAI